MSPALRGHKTGVPVDELLATLRWAGGGAYSIRQRFVAMLQVLLDEHPALFTDHSDAWYLFRDLDELLSDALHLMPETHRPRAAELNHPWLPLPARPKIR